MSFLIDTDVIIYTLKGESRAREWMLSHIKVPKFVSVITYGELIYGARKSKHPEKNLATVKRVVDLFPILDINKGGPLKTLA